MTTTMILQVGTKYRIKNTDGTLSEFFTSDKKLCVKLLAKSVTNDDQDCNVYREIFHNVCHGPFIFIRNMDEWRLITKSDLCRIFDLAKKHGFEDELKSLNIQTKMVETE